MRRVSVAKAARAPEAKVVAVTVGPDDELVDRLAQVLRPDLIPACTAARSRCARLPRSPAAPARGDQDPASWPRRPTFDAAGDY